MKGMGGVCKDQTV